MAHLRNLLESPAAAQCLKRDLGFKLAENFRRFVIAVFLLRVGIHLNRLSDFAGLLQCRVSRQ